MHGGCDAAFALAFPVAFLLEIVPEVGALFRNVLRGGRLALLGLGFGGLGNRRGGVMVARNTGTIAPGGSGSSPSKSGGRGAPGGSRLRGGSGCGRLVGNGRSVRVAETETVLAMRAGSPSPHWREWRSRLSGVQTGIQGNGSAQGTSKGKSYIALNI